MTDLFGWIPGAPPGDGPPPPRKTPLPQGHAMPPGYGPDGETCGSCGHLHRNRRSAKVTYFKCKLMLEHWTGGRKTDVRARDPACSLWEKNE